MAHAEPQTTCSVDTEELARIRHAAVRAARAAGDFLMSRFGGPAAADEIAPHDVKLEADRRSEEVLVSELARFFPDDGVLAEERGFQPGRSDRIWIVDPLDGSVNFYHGIPYFAVSVACYDRPEDGPWRYAEGGSLSALGDPLVGVVYAPFFDELFVGVCGKAASCNDRRIAVGRESSVSQAVIGISFGSREETMRRMCDVSAALVRDARKLRILGSTALDMAQVACGRMSALIQGRVRSWDFAAGRVILEQSGGVFHARGVEPEGWEILASAPGIYPSLEQHLKE